MDLSLTYATNSFESIFNLKGRPFGSVSSASQGVNDGTEGVQWNIRVDKQTGAAWLGVNLEGMKYNDWPIATFIENESRHSQLLEVASTLKGGENVWVAFYRDVWQVGIRPLIEERLILGSKVILSELTEKRWKQTLEEANACLDLEENHRARARQSVTLIKSGKREMEVSPHLNIHTQVWGATPSSEKEARALVRAGIEILSPIHEIVTSQSLKY